MAKQSTTPYQMKLDLHIEKEVEIDGVGMGVLSDGTPYLTLRGLARMCGVDHSVISRMMAGWNVTELRPREAKIKANLKQQGFTEAEPFIRIVQDGSVHHAFPDIVCMALLEYYAFEANSPARDHAVKNYRLLARKSFRDFIYTQIGYAPGNQVPLLWRQFHDRVSLVYDSVPVGYFSVFKEMANVIVTLISGGAVVDSHFIPDISVGRIWSDHWRDNAFDADFGARIRFAHNYPEYFPQAASNPQPAFCYPDAALGEFRRWMREQYLPGKFPAYLSSKVRDGALTATFSEKAMRALTSDGQRKRIA